MARLTASGAGPLRFSADPLPPGVRLDVLTGVFSGALDRPGHHPLRVRAEGPGGAAERDFCFIVGARLALTPPMGWNSWNCWAETVTADHVRASARALVAEGLDAHGWSHVNIDDGWQGGRERAAPHALFPNEKFPDLPGLVEELHAIGLRAGIYSTPWTRTYAGFAGGSSDHPGGEPVVRPTAADWWSRRAGLYHGIHDFSAADAACFARWGFDYLKYDWFPNDADSTRAMHAALASTGRDVVLSLSNALPLGTVTGVHRHAQLWRTTGDIRDAWSLGSTSPGSHQGIRDLARWHAEFAAYSGPGSWADPDMLVLGHVGWGEGLRPTRLTPEEQRTHFALWCLWSAPLLLGCPLDRLDAATRALLGNDDLIDLDQDALGVMAMPRALDSDGNRVIYFKPLANGDTALGLVNFGERPAEIRARFRVEGERALDVQHVRDLTARRDLGELRHAFVSEVPAHGAVVVRLSDPVA